MRENGAQDAMKDSHDEINPHDDCRIPLNAVAIRSQRNHRTFGLGNLPFLRHWIFVIRHCLSIDTLLLGVVEFRGNFESSCGLSPALQENVLPLTFRAIGSMIRMLGDAVAKRETVGSRATVQGGA